MKVRLALSALALLFVLTTRALAVDATAEWDQFAAQYNFPTVAAASIDGSFAEEYYGRDLDGDFHAVLRAVAEALNAPLPPFVVDDELKASVENWPLE